MQNLSARAASASHALFVQAMTFEGDKAGEQLIRLMMESPAKDKRLLVDSYSKAVINDSFVFSPKYVLDKEFRDEVISTRRLIKMARENGIAVKFTNPLGFLMMRYPLRNHKKMVIVDEETSYLGGINFSDHNFEWHDMMIGMEDNAIGKLLADDFKSTWEGKNQSKTVSTKDTAVYFLNGRKSFSLYENLFDKIKKAKHSVEVISPYVSDPLLLVLRETATRGVQTSIISPSENNKSFFKNLLYSELRHGYFDLYEYPGMSHLKAILIDGKTLLFGSSNYDLISYYFEQEVVVELQDESLIADFKKQILNPARKKSLQVENATDSIKPRLVMNALKLFCRISSKTILRPH